MKFHSLLHQQTSHVVLQQQTKSSSKNTAARLTSVTPGNYPVRSSSLFAADT